MSLILRFFRIIVICWRPGLKWQPSIWCQLSVIQSLIPTFLKVTLPSFLVWCKLWAPDENQRVHSVKTPDFSDQQLNVDNRLLIIVYVRSFPVMTGQNRIIQILKCFKSQVILEAQNVILSFNSIKPDLLTDAARAIFFVFYNQYYY